MQASHLMLATFFCKYDNDATQSNTTPRGQNYSRRWFEIQKGMRKSHLAETPPGVWVAHIRSDTITVAVARYTLGEAIVSRSTAITLSATDSRLATTKIQSQIQRFRRQVQLYTLTSTTHVCCMFSLTCTVQ